MKKGIFILVIFYTILIINNNVYADTINSVEEGSNTSQANVTASYNPSTTTEYSVDITWGSLKFAYFSTAGDQWDSENHVYTGSTAGDWLASPSGTANAITVKNNSNKDVKIKFEITDRIEAIQSVTSIFSLKTSMSSTDTTFTPNTLILKSAVGRNLTDDLSVGTPVGKVILGFDGAPSKSFSANSVICKVTLTLQP